MTQTQGGIIMPVTNVTIDSVQPTDTDVTVQWESDQMAFSQAVVYVAATEAGLNDPTQRMTGVGQTPDTEFKATVPADGVTFLNSGAPYFVCGVCDGVTSPAQSFTTLPEGVHLHDPNAAPMRIQPGGTTLLSVVVKKHKQGVANIPVTFTAPADAGQVGPVGGSPSGSSVQVNSDSNGLAQATLTAGSATGVYKVVASSPGYATNQPKIRVAVRNKA
jgi:hypothetical protein